MDRDIVARVEDWETRPYEGGFSGLADLEAAEFSGAVTAGGAWLFMLNGRIVGVFDGSLSTFEGSEGTAYSAPHPVLPLLFAMRETGGETKARYYTDDTPLSEVDETLSSGSFTGYVELSENVMSGDYYVVYHAGRSLSAAFIGNEERLITEDEAFERANDEVGIYEVRAVELDVQSVPTVEPESESEPEPDSGPEPQVGTDPDSASTSRPGRDREPDSTDVADTGRVSGPSGEAAGPADPAPEREIASGPDPESAPGTDGEAEADAGPTTTDPEPDRGRDDEPSGGAAVSDAEVSPVETDRQPGRPSETESEPGPGADTDVAPDADRDGRPEREPDRAADAETEPVRDAEPTDEPGSTEGRDGPGVAGSAGTDWPETATPDASAEGTDGDPFSEEAEWRETRTIPALDPEETEQEPAESATSAAESEPSAGDESAPEPDEPEPTEAGSATDRDPARPERIEELEAAVRSREERIARLEERVDEVASEREAVEEERDRLERRVDQLRTSDDGPSSSGQSMDPESVLDQTDLFVRYGSKGGATLEKAHDGEADRGEVNDNLRIEDHTRFDAAAVTVDGRPYDEFLTSTLEYRFVAWLVENLLYEVRETGRERGLRDLYDALPRIDRASFDDAVTMRDDEGGEVRRTFDVVLRDRMGQPLVVADINDARDPATGEMMSELVERATDVAEGHDEFAGAFLVTASFFAPDALETANEATGSGFLKRESRQSFVKLSRKRGYHLCLVEARREEFHVAVPEL